MRELAGFRGRAAIRMFVLAPLEIEDLDEPGEVPPQKAVESVAAGCTLGV